jgi:hypothetical protein
MRSWVVAAFVFFCAVVGMPAQSPKRMELTGTRAQQLVSILVSGSEEIRAAVRDQGATEIVVHDLVVRTEATYKYDAGSAYFNLAVHHATGRIGTASEAKPLGDATALFALFTSLRLPSDADMQGSSFELATVDCRIDTALDGSSPQRFRCTLNVRM